MPSSVQDRTFARIEDLPRSCVILDANALLSPFQQNFNLDIELEKAAPGFEPVVPSSVIRELETLNKDGDWKVKAAIQLSANYPCVEVKGRGDAPIFNLAVRTGWMVMTQDRMLRSNLRKKGIPVIMLRGKGRLQIMEP
ncbi:MAG: PIN domain-containing protein [Thermoplasmatota archaeon]